MERSIGTQLQALDQELFEHHAGVRVPMSLFLIAYFVLVGGFGIVEYCRRVWLEPPVEATEVIEPSQRDDGQPPSEKPPPGWSFPFVVGFLILGLYLLLANDLGSGDRILPHGGYLKTRLALLPPLFWLACLREPAHSPTRLAIRAMTALLVIVNLYMVTQTMAVANTTLEQYTAGVEAVGRGHRLLSIQSDRGGPLVNPLANAAHYYCLGTDNLNLDNYEASTAHFPIKYRKGVVRGRISDAADVLIYWQTSPDEARPGWDEIFTKGALRIYRRQPKQ